MLVSPVEQLSTTDPLYVPSVPEHPGPAETVLFGGQEMVGGATSFKVTVIVQVEVLPLPSLAVSVTV